MSKHADIDEVLPPEGAVRRGRPNKIHSLVPQRTAAERIALVNSHYHAARCLAAQAAMHAIMAGLELLAVREELGHGAFAAWVEENCEFTDRTARNYMALADAAKGKLAAGESFAGLLEAGPSELSSEDCDNLTRRVREITDGKSLQQLYLDFGVGQTRTPVDRREAGGAGKETEDHGDALLAEKWSRMVIELRRFVLERHWHLRLMPADLDNGSAALKDVLQALKNTGR
jgi:hypothetical protein